MAMATSMEPLLDWYGTWCNDDLSELNVRLKLCHGVQSTKHRIQWHPFIS